MKTKHLLFALIALLMLSSCNFLKKSDYKTIYIGPVTQPCSTESMETECLQIKWTNDQAEWENFFGQIEGFNFEAGYEYQLIVKEEKVENPPADAASVKYKLIREVSKVKADLPESTYTDNSRNSLDWVGTYEGILPCADCEGIKTTITLNADGTFNRSQEYLGKKGKVYTYNGQFEWNNEGSRITLIDNNENRQYQVGENQLFHLDNDGNRIEGNLSAKYILKKTDDQTSLNNPGFEDKKWLLVSFLGKNIQDSENEFYIIFNSKDKRLNTKVGCNVMNAGYNLINGLTLEIKPIMSTRMACPENSIEDEYIKNLETVNNVTTNGELLHLNRARMTIATYKLVK